MNRVPFDAPHRAFVITGILFAAFLLSALTSLAKPRSPGPPLPEAAPVLWHGGFDEAYSFRSSDAQARLGNWRYQESWSGYALERSGAVTPLIIPGLDSSGRTNVMAGGDGAIRFWVRPSWSSASAAGKGPRSYVRLAELNVSGLTDAVWSLQMLPDGSALSLVAQSDAGPVELLNAPVSWQAGVFHLVVFNFGPQGTALFIDGRLAAQSAGTLAVPPNLCSLSLGSTLNGAAPIQGDLEEAFSFARPLTESEVDFYYRALRDAVVSWQLESAFAKNASLGLQTATLDSASMEALMEESGPPPPPGGGGGGGGGGTGTNSPPFWTLGLGLCVYQPIFTSSNSLMLIITNTPDSGWLTNAYDLFYTTNLASLAEPALSVTNWAWLARSTPGQTNFVVSEIEFPQCFFRLGTMQDSDSDGLTDAYELLVSHTNPQNPDTDGDGFTDGWEVANRLNPRLDDSAQPASRINYIYDGSGWLETVSGVLNGGVTLDPEGNVLQASQ